MNRKPTPRSAKDLVHPKATTKAWNGDQRKARSDRWNGSPDMDDTGFMSRGVHTVTPPIQEGPERPPEGPTTAPNSVRYIKPRHQMSDAEKAAQDASLTNNEAMVYSPYSKPRKRRANDDNPAPPLTDKQLRLVHRRGRR